LVRQLVELHGGRVEAASGGEGKGSKFTVAFPLQPGTDSFKMQEMSIKEPAPRPALEGLRVLLVEDDDDTREMIAYALLQSAASVTEAGSASEALLHVEGPKPDVIISDIGMAGIDGYQFLAKMRELGCDSVPAIAVTAYANPADQERALRAGFHAYLAKPIELTELISLVGDLARWRS
jgi:CheY-like chemotaxis protein